MLPHFRHSRSRFRRVLAAGGLGLSICAVGIGGCGVDRPQNLVLVVVDTLRADHLSWHGYDRETSPFLAGLAGEAVVFEHCLSPIPLTDPAMSSLLTGTYPFQHGVRDTGYAMVDGITTLAEVLRDHGYRTGAFFSRAGLVGTTGLGRGFELADDHTVAPEEVGPHPWQSRAGAEMWQRRAHEITDLAIDWVRSGGDEPFFLLLHYFDPHAYYDPPEPFLGTFDGRPSPHDDPDLRSWWGPVESLSDEIARYDGEILTVDHHLERFVAELQRAGLWQRSVVVLTADHGESLGEHGVMDHGEWLYEEQLHVPLLVHAPGLVTEPVARVSQMVRLIDVMPTALDLLRVADLGSEARPGRSLVSLMAGRTLDPGPLLLETENCPADPADPKVIGLECFPTGVAGKTRGVHDGRFKLIVTPMKHGRRVALFDLEQDPNESNDLATELPAEVARLGNLLEGGVNHDAQGEVDADLVEQLRALGYAD